jgi:uncharacterized protein HemY
MVQRVLTQSRVVLFYISLLFLPLPARLNIDHHFPLSHTLLDPLTTILAVVLLAGLLVPAILLARKERLLAFCLLWFFGNLVIESSVIGLEIIFEHRVYLPSMLGIVAAVIPVDRLPARRGVKMVAALLVLVLLSFWTIQRNMTWRDEVSLRRDAAAKSPAKPRALAILANALERNGNYGDAELYYRKTLDLAPSNADEIHYNLGNVLMARSKTDKAIQHYRKALSLNSNAAPARLNLAYALTLQGRLNEASNELQELLRRHPDEPRAHNNLGIVRMKQERFNEAVFHFGEALALKPDYRQARINLERALKRLEKEKVETQ